MATTITPQEESPPTSVPAATSFVVSFDSPNQPAPNSKPNKFVKRHMRNLSLPVANVYSTNNYKINNNYSESNGVTKPLENHSEGYFSSDPEDEQLTKPSSTDIIMSTSQIPLDSARSSQRSHDNSSKYKTVKKSNSRTSAKLNKEDDEDKSDGGTYTIDQDSNEVINARLSIDKTFGITTSEQKFQDFADESHPSANTPETKDWIDQWATQVLEQNQKKSPLSHPRGVLSKIPSPVYTRAKLPPAAPMNTPRTDLTPTSPPKQRTVSLSAVHIQDDCSDSSLETESYLRTTEQVVSDMFARAASHSKADSGDSDCEPDQVNGKADQAAPCQRRSLIDRTPSSTSSNKYNRAFSLRRNKNVTSSKSTESPSSTVVKKAAPPLSTRQPFSRTDCGRFSMRTPVKPVVTPSLSVPKSTPPPTSASKKKPSTAAARSNSTLSSREMEFQNWKRRKSYDPMKAAAEGKKGKGGKTCPMSASMTQSVCLPSEDEPVSSVLRSASFHGTNQLKSACGVKSSSDDNEEEGEEEDWNNVPQGPKTSLETTPRGSRTSLCSLGTNSSSSNIKLKTTKIEGVDSMVITAIASMSCKLKANSSHFLRKLRVLYSEENAKHGLLTNEIEKLNLADSLNNSPIKSPSRQLTATLCNLKKIESALRVMDEAIFDCEEFE